MSFKHRITKLEAAINARNANDELKEAQKVMWFYTQLATAPHPETQPTNEDLRQQARAFWLSCYGQAPPENVRPYYEEALRWIEETRE